MKQLLIRQLSPVTEELNFLLTNRIPRVGATRLLGWSSRLRKPWLVRPSIALWQRFGGLDLSDALRPDFASVHECFTRELRPGSRSLDMAPGAIVSPCDGQIMACGALAGIEALQAKGLRYTLAELLGSTSLAERCRDGVYATIRLSSGMYHRFHAPADGTLERVTHIAGDTWNVNPPAVRRVPSLYCRNERAVLELQLGEPEHTPLLLVPVAAVGVAGLRLRAVPGRLGLGYDGPRQIDCASVCQKGDELGWFEQGSTIIVIAPQSLRLAGGIVAGSRLRMGERLMMRRVPADRERDRQNTRGRP
jgi:phosphatidylserine decarboxylase